MTPVPLFLFTQSCPERCLSFPRMKKVLKGKRVADGEEEKQKTEEGLKGIQIDEFKTCSEQWKNVLVGVLHQMKSPLKVTEVYTCKNKSATFQ